MTPAAAQAATDALRVVTVVGTGETPAGVVAQVRAATGWSVYGCRTLSNTLNHESVSVVRLLVLAGDAVDDPFPALLAARGLHPGADVLMVLQPGATVLDRCRLWEAGASLVLVEPVFPREVLAAVGQAVVGGQLHQPVQHGRHICRGRTGEGV